MEQKKKIRIAVIVLSALLAVSLLALGGTFIYRRLAAGGNTTVSVPDNVITSTGDIDTTGTTAPVKTGDGNGAAGTASTTKSSTGTTAPARRAAAIALYDKQPQDNTPFQAVGMLPGDLESKFYRVQVSYQGKVTVHYHADIRDGYEKLAEVLKVRIRLLTTGETLYDGLMRDMPKSLTHTLASQKETTDELYYQIDAYFDTSVGNAYQNKQLIADFRWWVEEVGELRPPKTGEDVSIVLWSVAAMSAAALVILLLMMTRKRKEDAENG